MKTTITIAILLVTGNLAHTQEAESPKYLKLKQNYKYEEGYILNSDSVKVKGLIKESYTNEAKKFSVVDFVHLDGTKKKYTPGGIKGFGYSIYKFVSDDSNFYEVVKSGKKVSLYRNLSVNSWTAPGSPGIAPMAHSSQSEDLYVKRPNEVTFKLVRRRNFKEDFSHYFKDCEEVAAEIHNGKLTHKDIAIIVRNYNYCK